MGVKGLLERIDDSPLVRVLLRTVFHFHFILFRRVALQQVGFKGPSGVCFNNEQTMLPKSQGNQGIIISEIKIIC